MIRRLLVAVLIVTATAMVTYQLWPVAESPSDPPTEEGYLDLHVHAAGIGAGDSGCFLSEEMREGFKFDFYLRAFDVTLAELEREGDAVLLRKLSEKMIRSRQVEKAVVLALDGVIDEAGQLDEERTQVYVPNEFLARELASYDNLLFGASINPYREDALARLQWAKDNGAVLLKWIPGIMGIDPADRSLIPFYERLRELGLPLLTHAGQERSFGDSDDMLGDPRRLELPLSLGVTVIVAHIASTGIIDGQDNFDRLLSMFSEHQNLYADISALTQVNRRGYLIRALEMPEIRERLAYGSDWPLQFFPLVSPWYQYPNVDVSEIKAIQSADNKWDRDVALKRAMGVSEDVFRRSSALIETAH